MLSIPFCTAIAQDKKEPLNIDDVISSLAVDEQTCIILYDTASGEVLFEQNADAKTKTASTAKLLTCVVALQNSEMDENVTISSASLNMSGSSLQLISGEQLSMKDLLNGMMVVSGSSA